MTKPREFKLSASCKKQVVKEFNGEPKGFKARAVPDLKRAHTQSLAPVMDFKPLTMMQPFNLTTLDRSKKSVTPVKS